MGRSREDIDLGAGVVDVVLALYIEPGLCQEPGQRVPDHRPAPVPNMHRTRRIGGDEFDIDTFAAADRRVTKRRAGTQDSPELRVPDLRSKPDVYETRLGRGDGKPASAIIPA